MRKLATALLLFCEAIMLPAVVIPNSYAGRAMRNRLFQAHLVVENQGEMSQSFALMWDSGRDEGLEGQECRPVDTL